MAIIPIITTKAKLMYYRMRSVISGNITYEINNISAEFFPTKHIPKRLPEQPVVEELINDIAPSDIFYDIGANRGIYTCLAAKSLDTGHIYSFEPNPKALRYLKKNIAINDVKEKVTVYEKAISNSNGEKTFVIKHNSTGNTLNMEDGKTNDQIITVDCINLEQFVKTNDLPRPTVIKLDIEGEEGKALSTFDWILDDCRVLYCEIHEQKMENHDKDVIEEELMRKGYNIERIFDRSTEHYIIRAMKN